MISFCFYRNHVSGVWLSQSSVFWIVARAVGDFVGNEGEGMHVYAGIVA